MTKHNLNQEPGIGFMMPTQESQRQSPPRYPSAATQQHGYPMHITQAGHQTETRQPMPMVQQPGYPMPMVQQGYPMLPMGQPGYPTTNPGHQQHGSPNPAYEHNVAVVVPPHRIYNPQNKLLSSWGINSAFEFYLKNASSLHVTQKVELLEAFIGFETANKYLVRDQAGNKLFYALEEGNGCCTRQCCGNTRNFTMTVKDVAGNHVLLIDRPLNCSLFCGLCCPDSMTVTAPGGQVIGYVEQQFSLFYPKFKLKNAANKTVLTLTGPFCTSSCCNNVDFQLTDTLGNPVGQITKQWSGFVREFFTDADYFSISFPVQLDISMKAVCLAALFIIDFEFFEESPHGRQHSSSIGEGVIQGVFQGLFR